MAAVLPDPATSFGARVRARLREAYVVWFTTVDGNGTPQPNPVWFVWQEEHVLIYSRPDARRLAYLRDRPRVSLHFDGDGRGGDIVVMSAVARLWDDAPPAHAVREYVEKYRRGMIRVSGSPEAFSRQYRTAVHVRLTHIRGH